MKVKRHVMHDKSTRHSVMRRVVFYFGPLLPCEPASPSSFAAKDSSPPGNIFTVVVDLEQTDKTPRSPEFFECHISLSASCVDNAYLLAIPIHLRMPSLLCRTSHRNQRLGGDFLSSGPNGSRAHRRCGGMKFLVDLFRYLLFIAVQPSFSFVLDLSISIS